MLKIGMPKQSVINRMRQDSMTAVLIAMLFPNAPEAQQQNKEEADPSKPTAEQEAKLTKYRKMLKIGMPKQSVINRMRQDSMTAILIAMLFQNAPEAQQQNDGDSGPFKPTPEDEAKLMKYRKMLKIHMPKQSVINRMVQDQCTPDLIGILFPKCPEAAASKSKAVPRKMSLAEMMKKSKSSKSDKDVIRNAEEIYDDEKHKKPPKPKVWCLKMTAFLENVEMLKSRDF